MTTRSIGFLKNNDRSNKQLKTIHDLQAFMESEIRTIGQFENALNLEIRELDHIRHNFNIIVEQMDYLKKLYNTREQVVDKLLEQMELNESDIDLQQSKQYMTMIQNLDQQIFPMSKKIHEEVVKLYLGESHKIFMQNENNRKILSMIDKDARSFAVEIKKLNRNAYATSDELRNASEKIAHLERERHFNTPDKGEMGFSTK